LSRIWRPTEHGGKKGFSAGTGASAAPAAAEPLGSHPSNPAERRREPSFEGFRDMPFEKSFLPRAVESRASTKAELNCRILPFIVGFLFCVMLGGNVWAAEKIRIVTTTNTLASFTHELLGEHADIYHVAPPAQNIHFIQPTPKDVLKVKKAEALVHQGLDLEAWRDPLLVAAGNSLFLGDAKAAVDVSKGIPLIEIPTSLSRAQGDIHQFGNPHYAIDPENARIIMKNIAEGLSNLFPEHAEEIHQNADAWDAKMDVKMKDWNARMEKFRGAPVVTYHRSWPYFLNRFGLVVVSELEPKPGIPPTPKHIAELIQIMKEKQVRVIIKEPFNESGTPKKLAKETGAKVVTFTQDVGGIKGTDDYLSLIDYNVRQLENALGK